MGIVGMAGALLSEEDAAALSPLPLLAELLLPPQAANTTVHTITIKMIANFDVGVAGLNISFLSTFLKVG